MTTRVSRYSNFLNKNSHTHTHTTAYLQYHYNITFISLEYRLSQFRRNKNYRAYLVVIEYLYQDHIF